MHIKTVLAKVGIHLGVTSISKTDSKLPIFSLHIFQKCDFLGLEKSWK